jgi:hypothetical protein
MAERPIAAAFDNFIRQAPLMSPDIRHKLEATFYAGAAVAFRDLARQRTAAEMKAYLKTLNAELVDYVSERRKNGGLIDADGK